MTKAEIISSLLDQARDKDALANGEADSIFADDARALREAAELLKSVPEWVPVADRLPNDDATRLVVLPGDDNKIYMEKREYGVTWRCWLRRPTKREKADTPWEDKDEQ